jgi:catalase
MEPIEQDHIVGAFSFELANVSDPDIQDRQLANLVAVDADLAAQVAANLGRPVPTDAPASVAPVIESSPALSMVPSEPGRIDGRAVGVIIGDGVDAKAVAKLAKAVAGAGAVLHVVGPHGGTVDGVEVARTLHACDSVQFDALVLEDSGAALLEGATGPFHAGLKVGVLLQEAFRHHKAVGSLGSSATASLAELGIDTDAPGVVSGSSATKAFLDDLLEAVAWHRWWERADPA